MSAEKKGMRHTLHGENSHLSHTLITEWCKESFVLIKGTYTLQVG